MDPYIGRRRFRWGRWALLLFTLLVLGAAVFYAFTFRAPSWDGEIEQFVVPFERSTSGAVLPPVSKLKQEGFVRSSWALGIALGLRGVVTVTPGGYELSKSMNAWEVAGVLSKDPALRWVVIPEGYRKEQILERLVETFGWDIEQQSEWMSTTNERPDYVEGVYFPDTYLIPVDEAPRDVVRRMQARFEEKFTPFAAEAEEQNIRWVTVLRIASLIEREAAGPDKPLIAGIIWNRLDIDMPLQIDASLQYPLGNSTNDWWPKVRPEDKQIDSPYNTYKNIGLPPYPIANPGLESIEAVLFPEETECLYYLHDDNGDIYCSETYDEHLDNIDEYLR